MRKIDYPALSSWCAANGYDLRDWAPCVRGPARNSTCKKLDNLQQLPEFLDTRVNIADTERLVWIRDWTIWDERSQEIGLRGLELLTDNLSEAERRIDSHAYILNAAEWREAIALLVWPIVFGWYAHLLFGLGAAAVNFSHHGRIDMAFPRGSIIPIERLSGWCEMDLNDG